MNGAAIEVRSWSGGRWVVVTGLVMGFQLVLLALFARPAEFRRRPPRVEASTRFVFEGNRVLDCGSRDWLSDPSQFALANAHGFSGAAWLRWASPLPASPDWSEAPRWLVRPAPGAGGELTTGSLAGRTPDLMVVAKPATAASVPGLTARAELAQASVRLEGGLTGHRLQSALALPVWEGNDVLSATVVQVLVSPEGAVLSATLLDASGLPLADERALELARAARFEPRMSAELTWGRLVFPWHTVPRGGAGNPERAPAP